jgi:hypothetical protein
MGRIGRPYALVITAHCCVLSGLEASVPNILSIKSFRNYSEMF